MALPEYAHELQPPEDSKLELLTKLADSACAQTVKLKVQNASHSAAVAGRFKALTSYQEKLALSFTVNKLS